MNDIINDTKVHYSEQEKLFLVQLVCESKDIIENKKTDSMTLRDKNQRWKEICEAYCHQGFKTRTPKQLKKLWENIKQRRRKMTLVQRQRHSLTGDPLTNASYDPVIEFVDREVPIVESLLGNSNSSNHVFQKTNNGESNMEKMNAESDNSIEFFDVTKKYKVNNVSTPHPSQIRKLQSSRQATLVEEEIQLRIQKLEEAIQQQRELHNKRMQIAEAEYKTAVLKLLEAEEQAQHRANKL
ncbi:hypothetical protein AMK59_1831 [Oryctes borbonicus]|uniref:Regulatory protein zeste n=1 Tax=Oryctes borbonicus TaxID=1629725 RepID=A0A0T6BHT4_9SCAR|nr:hypothetical protein AMK59_1831 [Oryctes borbonicus]